MSTQLSQKQEELLVKYFDGEHSWVEGIFAKKLLKSSDEAQSFLESMKRIQEIARNDSFDNMRTVNLWDKIESRIEAEERAAVYLGGRREEPTPESWFSKILGADRMAWGVGGAVAASVITYVALGVPFAQDSRYATKTEAKTQKVHVARLDPKDLGVPVPLGGQNVPTAMPVDWMRSSGRVRITSPSGQRIIVINRRHPGSFSQQEPLIVYPERTTQSLAERVR